MASASCSSTSFRTPELLCCSQSLRRWNRELRLLDDRNFLVNGNRLLFDGKTAYRLVPVNEKRTSYARTDNVQLLGKSNFSPRPLRKQYAPLIKAVATVERTCLVPCETGSRGDSDMHFSNDSDSQVFQSPEDTPEMDEKEKLRRMRISKANKGNVPWNKGRKHSAETRQRIRERTRIAMQDPKVKMKLVNLGHAQRLLIAEAEKAAKALEVAALKSPLALASLNETRKLIAEAVRSIESIEKGQIRSQETEEEAQFYSTGPTHHFRTNRDLDERVVNGSYVLPSSDSDYKDIDVDKFTLDNTLSNGEPLHVSESTEDSGLLYGSVSPLLPNIPREDSSRTDLQAGQTKMNSPVGQNNLPHRTDDDRALQAKHNGRPIAPATKTKKWVCGRLVEVEEG